MIITKIYKNVTKSSGNQSKPHSSILESKCAAKPIVLDPMDIRTPIVIYTFNVMHWLKYICFEALSVYKAVIVRY